MLPYRGRCAVFPFLLLREGLSLSPRSPLLASVASSTYSVPLVWLPGLHRRSVSLFAEMSGGCFRCLDILLSAPPPSLHTSSLPHRLWSFVIEFCHFPCPAGSSVNGLEEPSIAKRLRGTPERIELENYRLSVKQAEELEEVPEETQAEHNLSSVLDKGAEEDVASRSACARGLQPHFLVCCFIPVACPSSPFPR